MTADRNTEIGDAPSLVGIHAGWSDVVDFADVGRAWGENPLGPDHREWLTDVGIGLRLAMTRVSAGRVVHIDLAFPLNGDSSIDDVQFLIESRNSF